MQPYMIRQILLIPIFIGERLSGADFASSTAIGLFKSVINFALLISANFIVKKGTGNGIY